MVKDNEYTTKGLPPPPPISITTKPMAGLLVDIYGLEELPPAPAPVSCLWLLHPRTRARGIMHDVARRTIHAWNQSQPQNPARGLVALVFDMPNHGTRTVSELANKAWDQGNEQHAMDMLGFVRAAAADVSLLMDQVAGYLGREEVDGHVCLGWSLGGHAAWESWFAEERVDAAVVVVGCPDLAGLLSSRAAASKLDCGETGFLGSKYFPADTIAAIRKSDPKGILFGTDPVPSLPLPQAEQDRLRKIFDGRIRGKKLLLCSGAADELVPYKHAQPLIGVLKDAAEGWYRDGGLEVDDRVYEGVGHKFSAEMVGDAVEFLVRVFGEGRRGRDGGEARAKM
ncbi:alpha/beta-hydrolase [Trichoderma longibrachiatum]|uniref:Alpha/beta-hydrolase n=1 Tax=Trichoderma longibrachiatum ATCC 18648 TaxID=983965 RepID=A0A2T4C030_TRILO|nr:alpha/beta-hydrolase [Trichoderma longibrachiatum ATCC 18648]